VGVNSWQSRGAGGAPDSAPGLRGVDLELSDANALNALARSLAEASPAPLVAHASDSELSVRDPDGQLLRFSQR
jgi:catechol-2,3-dioxygenase